jgi:site-specific recombinase XerD
MTTTTAVAVQPARSDQLPAIERELDRDPRLKSPNTRRGYLNDLRRFEEWRAGRPLSKMLVEEYAAVLQHQDRAASGINRALAAIRWWSRRVGDLAFEAPDMGRAQREEIVTQAARVAAIPDVKGSRPQVGRHVPYGEIDALLRACANDHTAAGVRDGAIIALGTATGMRRAEIAGLSLADFQVTDRAAGEGVLTIRGKGDKARVVDVCNGAYANLADWLSIRGDDPGALFYAIRRGGHVQRGDGLTTEALAQMLAKRCQQAGIAKRTSWHDLRRTLAGDLLDNGADVVTVQKILGHASPVTTSRYDRRPEETRRRALRGRHVPYYGGRMAGA